MRKEKKCILVAGRVGSAHRGYMMVIGSRWTMTTLHSYKTSEQLCDLCGKKAFLITVTAPDYASLFPGYETLSMIEMIMNKM